MDDPAVLLIGGPPGAGKTTLARAVAAQLGYLATTVDDLVSTARFFTDQQQRPDIHQGGGTGHVRYFTDSPPERLIADALTLEQAMWPLLERLIYRHGETKTPIVFDWWLLNPAKVVALPPDAAKSVWLHIDPEVLEARERANTEFRADSSDPERMHTNFMVRSLWRNDLIAGQATALGLPMIHQPGDRSVDDLTSEVLRVI